MSRVAARVFQPLIQYARIQGLSVPKLLAGAGISQQDLKPDKRLPETAAVALCRRSLEQSGDPLFALKAGLAANPQSLGVLAYVLQNSPTVRAAFFQLQRYWNFLHDEPLFHLFEDASQASLAFRADAFPLVQERRPLMEYLVGFLLQLSGSMIGPAGAAGSFLQRVDFRFVQPSGLELRHYQQLLGCQQIRFGQAKTAVVFDVGLLAQPLPYADPQILSLFQQELRQIAEATGGDIVSQLRGLLRARYPGHLPSLPELAAELATSRASLQRRLAEKGCNYREIVQQLKQEAAIRLLQENRHSLAEIAFMLGFADAASFHHAFKRWTGKTPDTYRTNLGCTF